MPNTEQARQNMLDGQVRPWHVYDDRVLDALQALPRERFVPERFRSMAYADWAVPLDHGQVMTPAKVVGRMLEALKLTAGEQVLEIGTGTGYVTACLVHLGAHVTSIDLYPEFVEGAQRRLRDLGYAAHATLSREDATCELPGGQYDAILITASLPEMSQRYLQLVRPGGRLLAVLGKAPTMQATLLHRTENGHAEQVLFETCLPPLVEPPRHGTFRF